MNPYEIVEKFEEAVAAYTGSKYSVAVDNCSNALFLCCKYLKVKNVTIPCKTYVSVPCSIIHAGGSVEFKDFEWRDKRYYQLAPYPIYDSAQNFQKNMYLKNSFFCISFSVNKTISIGKGGMILTDSKEAANWFKLKRYCGRNQLPLLEDEFETLGWNMYMTPEQAARGLQLMGHIEEKQRKIQEYPDLSKYEIYKKNKI